MLSLTLLLLSSASAPAQGKTHEDLNPVYKALVHEGLQYSADVKIPLPPPLMPDGLKAAQQMELITKLAGDDVLLDQLLRESVVAPQILHINNLKPAVPSNPPRGVDAYFIAYGDLKKIASRAFLDRLVTVNKGEGEGQALDAKELAKRGISIDPQNKDREGYGWARFDLFQKVRLQTTGRSFWSETPDSIVVATYMDPRFHKDKERPNQWWPLTYDAGKFVPGTPQPYEAIGYYMKITRLEQPERALFVEAHIGFGEPQGWFNGANMLRSKLPPALQQQIRTIRREMLKVSEAK